MIELMIVIGIIGLLISLTIPAIQAAREASRRAVCASNMRQLGVALQAYHGSLRMFPPAFIWAPAGEPHGMGLAPPGTIDHVSANVVSDAAADRAHANWLIMSLPYLGEEALYRSYDMAKPVGHASNRSVRAAAISTLACPSDPANNAENMFQRAAPFRVDDAYARGNFAMNAGPNERCLARLGPKGDLETCRDGFQVNGSNLRTDTSQVWGGGVGGVNRSFTLADFKNGSSHTVALDEIRVGLNPLDRRGTWALGFVGCSVTAAHGRKGNAGPNRGEDRIQGCTSAKAYSQSERSYDIPCATQSSPMREVCEQATSRSHHPFGTHVLFADGSLQLIGNDIAPDIWEAMHNRSAAISPERN